MSRSVKPSARSCLVVELAPTRSARHRRAGAAAQRVRGDERRAERVAARVEEQPALAILLVELGRDQIGMARDQQLRDARAQRVRRRRSVASPSSGATTCRPFEPVVLTNGGSRARRARSRSSSAVLRTSSKPPSGGSRSNTIRSGCVERRPCGSSSDVERDARPGSRSRRAPPA